MVKQRMGAKPGNDAAEDFIDHGSGAAAHAQPHRNRASPDIEIKADRSLVQKLNRVN
jgi:hypothetical protein